MNNELVSHSYFQRPSKTYELKPEALEWIFADASNPLNQITKLILKKNSPQCSILDVGAGNGILAQLLQKKDFKGSIDGVEPAHAGASRASVFYRSLHQDSVQNFCSQNSTLVEYDFIILADVIEHLENPDTILILLKRFLKPGGCILISTPNVAYITIRWSLLNGHFDYVDSGILERTHLRFFTEQTLKDLFLWTKCSVALQINCHRYPVGEDLIRLNNPFAPILYSKLINDVLASTYHFVFVLSPYADQNSKTINIGHKNSPRQIAEYFYQKIKSYLNLNK